MNPTPLTAALLLLWACGEGDHDHGHDHDGEAGHDHVEQAPTPEADPAAEIAPVSFPAFALGDWTAQLEATGEGLKLTASDASAAAVAPEGEARVVLTGTGQEQQRVVLKPGDSAWTGAAKASSATGYIAVVSLEVEGKKESARVTWGEVPAVEAAPKAEEHPHGDDDHNDGHDHGHGHGH